MPLISIMHSRVDHIDGALDVLDRHWSGPVCVYAHDSNYGSAHSPVTWSVTPADYAEASRRWMGRGVRVIGSCCGFGVEYIEALREVV